MSSSSLSSHWLFTTTCSSDPWASSWYVTDPHTCGSFRLESLSWPSYETLYSIVAFQTWVILERVLKKAQTLEHTQMSSIDCKYPTQYVDASNAHTYCNRLFFSLCSGMCTRSHTHFTYVLGLNAIRELRAHRGHGLVKIDAFPLWSPPPSSASMTV